MKTPLLRTIVFTFAFSLFTLHSHGQWVSIPDTNFGTWLNTNGYSACMQGNNAVGWEMDTTCPTVKSRTQIICNNRQIRDLTGISYFDSLQILRCEDNLLSHLPALPGRLTALHCFRNQLNSISDLPNGLIELWCSRNQLNSLPPLPESLSILACDRNQFTVLPALPMNLTKLWCGKNQLTFLPVLPFQLKELYCNHNMLTSIPEFPDSLYRFLCDSNPELHCLPEFKKVTTLYFLNTGITCLRNYPQDNRYSNPPLNTVPLCDSSNDVNGCLVMSVDEQMTNPKFEMFPNPANDKVTITVDESMVGSIINITDVMGKTIHLSPIAHRTSHIELKDFSSGIYFVTIHTPLGKLATKKLVVQR